MPAFCTIPAVRFLIIFLFLHTSILGETVGMDKRILFCCYFLKIHAEQLGYTLAIFVWSCCARHPARICLLCESILSVFHASATTPCLRFWCVLRVGSCSCCCCCYRAVTAATTAAATAERHTITCAHLALRINGRAEWQSEREWAVIFEALRLIRIRFNL